MTPGQAGSDDAALLAAFRDGHEVAFEAIVTRHYSGLLRVAERRCGPGALAEDAVQAALVRAHRYLRSGHVAHLGAWLRRVAFNCATDLLASARPDAAAIDRAAEMAAPEDASLERAELRRIVEGGIGGLPEIYRAPLALHYLQGLDAREVAEKLGENLNSVKSRIARGRHELRRRLEERLRKGGYL